MKDDSRRRISFDGADGSVTIGGVARRLDSTLRKSAIPADLAALVRARRDMRTGWEWFDLVRVTLDGYPCGFSIAFLGGELREMSWGILLPDGDYTGDWPSEETIHREIAVTRKLLAPVFGPVGDKGRELPWGRVWCYFDRKAFLCNSGLRYRDPQPPGRRRKWWRLTHDPPAE